MQKKTYFMFLISRNLPEDDPLRTKEEIIHADVLLNSLNNLNKWQVLRIIGLGNDDVHS